MIKYVKEIKSTSKNLTTLLISNINEDRLELQNKVDKSLSRLLEQTLIQKNGEVYSFLTNEEQDINREIKNQIVDNGEVLDNAANRIFQEIYPKNKYRYSNRYNFQFNQSIDNKKINNREFDIGMRIITPFYTSDLSDCSQVTFEESNMHNILKGLSESNNEVVVHLLSDLTVFDEIKEALQIQKYLTKKSAEMKVELRSRKQEEYNDKIERIKLFLESSIKDAIIYIKGDKVDITEKNVESRLDESMGKLVDKVYNKLNYMDFAPDKSDIKKELTNEYQQTLIASETKAMNAVNDMDNYISDQSKLHNTLTLKSLLNRYSKAPYGFVNLDVQWLLASLFAQKRIVLTINSDEISLRNTDASKILDYLTKNEYLEKLLVSEKEVIDSSKIRKVKEVLKEVYSLNLTHDNDERIMDEFKRVNAFKIEEIDKCLLEFRISNKYPGKSILEESKELFNDANNKKNTLQFYNYVSDNDEEFLDLADDLDPVLAFFNGSQKAIFDESCEVCKVYEENINLINDSDLSDVASEIDRIISMPNPYSNIRKLPELNNKFTTHFDEILEDKKTIILNGINEDYGSIKLRLNTDELKAKFENKFISEFDSLKNKLDSEKNIAIIDGITMESENLKNNCIHEIDSLNKPVSPQPPIKIPVEVDVDIKTITLSPKVKIESEDQIDEFLQKVKTELKNKLENADIINLKL